MSTRTPLAGALVAEGISFVGTRVSMIAIPWFVLSTTGSATQTGLVAAAEITPLVIFKALGGPLLDRVGPRRVTLACDLVSAFVVAAIPLLHGLGMLSFPTLLVLVAVAGALRGPGDAGKAAMMPEIARTADWSLERVSGLSAAVERTSSMGGAALAGLLVATVGATNALYVDAASFLVSFVVFAARHHRPRSPRPSRGRRRRDVVRPGAAAGLGLHAHRAGADRDLRDGRGHQPRRPGLRLGARAGVGQGVRGRGRDPRHALRGDERRLGPRRARGGPVGRDAAALPDVRRRVPGRGRTALRRDGARLAALGGLRGDRGRRGWRPASSTRSSVR